MTAIAVEIAAPDKNAWAKPILAYSAYGLACAIFLQPTLLEMMTIWASSSAYAHGFAVAPLSIWMIMRVRMNTAPASNAGFLGAVLASAALWLMGRAAGVALIEQAAFICLLISGAGVIFGGAILRAWAFALGFLFFMVPFGESLTPLLQSLTANGALGLLNAIGVTATLDGYVIRTEAGLFEIAEACAGLNFLLAALMVAAIFSFSVFQDWRRRTAFLAIAFVVAIFANLMRASLVISLATLSDMRWAIGADHLALGIILYAAVFLVLTAIGLRMSASQIAAPRAPLSVSPSQGAEGVKAWRPYVGVAAIAIIAFSSLYAHFVIDRPVARSAPAALSLIDAPGWAILPPPKNWSAQLRGADRRAAATYDRNGARVYTAIGYFTHDRPHAEIIDYHHRSWDGDYWRRAGAGRASVTLDGKDYSVPIDYIAAPEYRRLAALTLYWSGETVYASPLRFKFDQMKAKLSGRNPPGGIIIMTASYTDHPADAVRKINAFIKDANSFEDWRHRQDGI